MNKDIVEYISRYLTRNELFRWLTANKFMYRYIGVYRRKYIFCYNKIRTNREEYYKIIIKGEIYENRWWNIFNKEYYIVKEILYYLNQIRYENIKIKLLDINLEGFNNLVSIEFDYYFDQEIKFNIPNSVKIIKFGRYFNKSIDNLPENIERIEFEEQSIFNLEIKKYPSKLKYIKFGYGYTHNIDNLPNGVEEINMKNCIVNYSDINKLPSNIKRLWLNMNHITCEIKSDMEIYYNKFIRIKKYKCKMIEYN